MQRVTITVDAAALRRFQTWGAWIAVSLLTFVFAILCFVAGGRMQHFSKDANHVLSNHLPVIITTLFTGIVVMLFILVSFFITWRRSKLEHVSRSLDLAFGVALFFMFLLTLLCAASMNGFRSYTKLLADTWRFDYKDSDYSVFVATFAMGYVAASFYFMYSMLVLCSTVVFVQTTKDEISSTKSPGLPVAAPASPKTGEFPLPPPSSSAHSVVE